MSMRALGARLRAARTLREWSLRDLAEMVGCHASTLCRYENGLIYDPSYSLLWLCAHFLGVTPGWLVDGWLPACADEEENAWLIAHARREPCPVICQVKRGM